MLPKIAQKGKICQAQSVEAWKEARWYLFIVKWLTIHKVKENTKELHI